MIFSFIFMLMSPKFMSLVQTSHLNSRLTYSAAYSTSLRGYSVGISKSVCLEPVLPLQSLPPALFLISVNGKSVLQLLRLCTWESILDLSNTPHLNLAANPAGSYLPSGSGIRWLNTTSANILNYLSHDWAQWSLTALPASCLALYSLVSRVILLQQGSNHVTIFLETF